MSDKPRSWRRRIGFGILGLLVLAFGGYVVALKVLKPDPAHLTAWGSDLEKALAEAKGSNKLVLVKAGSEY
ncbi:MAG: hypothetical protein HUU15_08575 [Candidatus Brocadiae bacterium]|nr:hypothetical protein [Candidatus Brocadiia bacterium]